MQKFNLTINILVKWGELMSKSQDRYDKEHCVQVKMKLNKKYDADILDRLNSVDNKQGYLKSLIREDLKTRKVHQSL